MAWRTGATLFSEMWPLIECGSNPLTFEKSLSSESLLTFWNAISIRTT